MNPIHDSELVLFHYRDGLAPQRQVEIGQALAEDAALSRRYATLQATLAAADLDRPPAPRAGFVDRVMAEVLAEPSPLAASPLPAMPHRSPQRSHRRRRWPAMLATAMAASLLLAVGFFTGRQTAPPVEPLVVQSDRVYVDALGRHLGATRRVLTSARLDGDSEALGAGNAFLARALLENHRLYMAAARHNGDRRLESLLQEIEPVLIELANPPLDGGIESRKGLGEFVEREDLIFQVRAVEAGLTARRRIET
jgi:hypothetical protein